MNSFDLYNSPSGRTVSDSDVILSLDMIALFTNVPQDITIDGISKRSTFNTIPYNTIQYNISKNDFILVIKFVLSSTYFTFKHNI